MKWLEFEYNRPQPTMQQRLRQEVDNDSFYRLEKELFDIYIEDYFGRGDSDCSTKTDSE